MDKPDGVKILEFLNNYCSKLTPYPSLYHHPVSPEPPKGPKTKDISTG